MDVLQQWECKLDASYSDSKVARVLVPKVHINGKINTIMKKN
jgi:hypothetical protein